MSANCTRTDGAPRNGEEQSGRARAILNAVLTHVLRQERTSCAPTVQEEVGTGRSVAIYAPTTRPWQKRTGVIYFYALCTRWLHAILDGPRSFLPKCASRVPAKFPNRVWVPSTFPCSNVTRPKGIATFYARPFCRPIAKSVGFTWGLWLWTLT